MTRYVTIARIFEQVWAPRPAQDTGPWGPRARALPPDEGAAGPGLLNGRAARLRAEEGGPRAERVRSAAGSWFAGVHYGSQGWIQCEGQVAGPSCLLPA